MDAEESRGLWRGLPRPVWAIGAVWLALLLTWSVLLPTFRSADEVEHVMGIHHLENHSSWPGFKKMRPDLGVRAVSVRERYRVVGEQRYPFLRADAAKPRSERPSFAESSGGRLGEGVVTIGQHPPGYYSSMAVISTALSDSTAADLEVWLLRLGSLLLMAPVPVCIGAAMRRLGGSRSAIITAASLPFAIPQFAATSAAINSDTALNAASVWVFLGVACVLREDLRWRTSALTGAALAVALMSKAFGLLLVPMVVGAYIVIGHRTRRLARAAANLCAAAVVAMAGGWWWVISYVEHGTLQPSGHLPPRPGGRAGMWESLGDFLVHYSARMPTRFWAFLSVSGPARPGGQPMSAFPWRIGAALSLVLILLLLAALLKPRISSLVRIEVAILLLPFLAALGLLTMSTWNIYARTGVPSGLQGRYLFVGLAGVFPVVAALLGQPARLRSSTSLPTAVLVFGGAFTIASLSKVLSFHYGTDHHSMDGAVGGFLAWAPVPEAVVAVIFAALIGSVAWLVGAMWNERDGGRSGADGDPSAPPRSRTPMAPGVAEVPWPPGAPGRGRGPVSLG